MSESPVVLVSANILVHYNLGGTGKLTIWERSFRSDLGEYREDCWPRISNVVRFTIERVDEGIAVRMGVDDEVNLILL